MPKKIDQPKETIIKVAREILETRGYEELSIRNLSKLSGVSVGTIYNYFEDKKTLDMYIMSAFWGEFEGAVQAIFQNDSVDFYEKLRNVQDEMGRFIDTFKELFAQVFQSRTHSYTDIERGAKNQMIKRMALNIEAAIVLENPNLSGQNPSPEEISEWILTSMMMVHHMKSMSYEQLEKFIRRVLS